MIPYCLPDCYASVMLQHKPQHNPDRDLINQEKIF